MKSLSLFWQFFLSLSLGNFLLLASGFFLLSKYGLLEDLTPDMAGRSNSFAFLFPLLGKIGGSWLLINLAVSVFLVRRISVPLGQFTRYAQQITQGNHARALLWPRHLAKEIVVLGQSLSNMAVYLLGRLAGLAEQKNELDVVFEGLIEGVITLNNFGEIIQLNAAARRMFGIKAEQQVEGVYLSDVIPGGRITKLLNGYLFFRESLDREITIEIAGQQSFVQVYGKRLVNTTNRATSALFVFHDVTKMRALEAHQREFVANVSHELKTPLTAIQGFVETLLDSKPILEKDRTRFLLIINKHVHRLTSLISDTLALSRMSRDHQRLEVDFAPCSLNDLIQGAVQICQAKLTEKNIILTCQLPSEINVRLCFSLMEQALVNLIDNAIKYSATHTQVEISLVLADKDFTIHIQDEGIGIGQEYLSLIFERFYRVDKARSRKVGGTGLGLSIVKHIAEVHGGTVFVRSEEAQGSVFSMYIPNCVLLTNS